jgi:ABC-type transport system involved in multi-copper enzyme maturation permease subunit
MIGPVFHLELVVGSRRGRLERWRRIYCAWLALQFLFYFGTYLLEVWASITPPPQGPGQLDQTAFPRFTSSYCWAFILQQFALLVLLTPAFVAGALTDEKSRGTLQYLLTTNLSAWEIVIGKLLGRLAQLGLIALAGLPLICLMGPLTGFNVFTILALVVFTVLLLVALGSASVLASVWSRQTRDAVIALYSMGIGAGLLFWGARELGAYLDSLNGPGAAPGGLTSAVAWLNRFLVYLDPRYVLAPADGIEQNLPELARRLHASALTFGSIAGCCLGLSVWRLRRAYIRQLEGEGAQRKERWWRPRRATDEHEPIRWKERFVEGIAPLPLLQRIPRWLGVVMVLVFTVVISASHFLTDDLDMGRLGRLIASGRFFELRRLFVNHSETVAAFWGQAVALVVLSSLLVGIRCSGSVSGERERQTWEALLLTPLPIRELIRGKLWGIIGATRPYFIAYLVPAFILSALAGSQALVATALSALVVWPAMYFVGSVGMWYSVSSRSSWQGLLATLGVGYVGGFLICIFSMPVILFLSMLLLGMLYMLDVLLAGGFASRTFDPALWVSLCVAFAWAWLFGKLAHTYLLRTQKWVEGRERTPYWKSGVNCGFWVEEYMTRWENKNA